MVVDRDVNGSRNIMMKNLNGKSPLIYCAHHGKLHPGYMPSSSFQRPAPSPSIKTVLPDGSDRRVVLCKTCITNEAVCAPTKDDMPMYCKGCSPEGFYCRDDASVCAYMDCPKTGRAPIYCAQHAWGDHVPVHKLCRRCGRPTLSSHTICPVCQAGAMPMAMGWGGWGGGAATARQQSISERLKKTPEHRMYQQIETLLRLKDDKQRLRILYTPGSDHQEIFQHIQRTPELRQLYHSHIRGKSDGQLITDCP